MLTAGLVLASLYVIASIFSNGDKKISTKAEFIGAAIGFVIWLFAVVSCFTAIVKIN